MNGREVKDALYEQFSRVGKAVSSPRRIELLELLAQGERSVDALARTSGLGLTTASAHLQVLRATGLVATRREGTRIHYRLAEDGVAELVDLIRRLARAHLAEVDRVAQAYFGRLDALDPMGREELLEQAHQGAVILIDVRPREEFDAGHIPGAVSVPFAEIEEHLDDLPEDAEVVAYCRGPYCVLAPQAVELLTRAGISARRLQDGLPEWRLAGLPVAVGGE